MNWSFSINSVINYTHKYANILNTIKSRLLLLTSHFILAWIRVIRITLYLHIILPSPPKLYCSFAKYWWQKGNIVLCTWSHTYILLCDQKVELVMLFYQNWDEQKGENVYPNIFFKWKTPSRRCRRRLKIL